MIQPHLPIRLPCYDFTPITSFTFGDVLLAVRLSTSGPPGSHGVTGAGVWSLVTESVCIVAVNVYVLISGYFLSSCTYEFSTGYQSMNSGEFPHSEISGSMLICSSPKLFAAYHVFHRLPVPRHSPCALFSLTVIFLARFFHLPTKEL